MNYDSLLRPKRLTEVIGLEEQKVLLNTVISAAKKQKRPVGHILLTGSQGLGKTTLAHVIANEMQATFWQTAGTNLATQLQDYETLFTEILPTLEKGGIIFVDEVHRVANLTQDTLLPWLERNWLSVKYRVPEASDGKRKGDWKALEGVTKDFTFVAATTRAGLLEGPFRDRFKLKLHLDFYDTDSMFQILRRSAWLMELLVSDAALLEIAKRSKGVPRIGNNNLWYCQQWQIANDHKFIDQDRARAIIEQLGLDRRGLDRRDRKLLQYLLDLDRPVGATTICAYLSEDRNTLENVIEPHLIRMKLIQKTPRGRALTKLGRQHMGIQ